MRMLTSNLVNGKLTKEESEKVQHDNISAHLVVHSTVRATWETMDGGKTTDWRKIWQHYSCTDGIHFLWPVECFPRNYVATLVLTAFISFGLLNVFPEIMLRKTSSISTRKPVRGWCTACKECEKRVFHTILWNRFCFVFSVNLDLGISLLCGKQRKITGQFHMYKALGCPSFLMGPTIILVHMGCSLGCGAIKQQYFCTDCIISCGLFNNFPIYLGFEHLLLIVSSY
jgi:hypothetical protein